MSEIGFYHLTRTSPDQALPQLLGRTLAAGQRAIVLCGSEERRAALDDGLWLSAEPDWLPHGGPPDTDGPLHPIWLTTQDPAGAAPNGAAYLFLLDGATGTALAAYARIFILFDGADPAALQRAREGWTAARAAGHGLTYWRQTERGWEKG
jgi:DNA polymerase-3 subunit chi